MKVDVGDRPMHEWNLALLEFGINPHPKEEVKTAYT